MPPFLPRDPGNASSRAGPCDRLVPTELLSSPFARAVDERAARDSPAAHEVPSVKLAGFAGHAGSWSEWISDPGGPSFAAGEPGGSFAQAAELPSSNTVATCSGSS